MVANVLIALNKSDSGSGLVVEKIQKVYRYKLINNSRNDIGIGRIEFVFKESEIDVNLSSGRFDILLVTETIEGNINIGSGTLRQWAEKYPDVRIFLLVEKEKKGAGKLTNLYIKGYYDALYWQEIAEDDNEFFNTLKNGRSKEAAFIYYGLTEDQVNKELDKLAKKKKPEELQGDVLEIKELQEEIFERPTSYNEKEKDYEPTVESMQSTEIKENVEGPKLDSKENALEESPAEQIIDKGDDLLEGEKEDLIHDFDGEIVDEYDEEEDESEPVDFKQEDMPDYSFNYSNYNSSDGEEGEMEDLKHKETGDYQEHYPQIYLDLAALNAESKVHYSFDGQISEIITDDVMIIKCPGGGLIHNKEALKGLNIHISWEENY